VDVRISTKRRERERRHAIEMEERQGMQERGNRCRREQEISKKYARERGKRSHPVYEHDGTSNDERKHNDEQSHDDNLSRRKPR
jgi:hypothetical protein